MLLPFHFITRTQYAHNVILTSIRRRPNVMDVVWTLKQRCVRTGFVVCYTYLFIVHSISVLDSVGFVEK